MKYNVTVLIETCFRVLVISVRESSTLEVLQSPSWKNISMFEGLQEAFRVCVCLGLEINALGDGNSPTQINDDIYRQNILYRK